MKDQADNTPTSDHRPLDDEGSGAGAMRPGRPERAPATVGEMIGPYKILETIGEGGMGTVYVAEQAAPIRRRVALKVIKLGMDTKAVVARFEAERQALAMMDHPGIARVFDAGATESGRPWFAMELVRGVPITEYCDTHNLSTRERIELFMSVCHAVQHAHQKGVIHRDLKPTNILVTVQDGEATAKVIDFGVAKATSATLTEKTIFTHHGQLVGTPEYMSPEQAEMTGLDIDTRSDVYSLGVLLYELLTGVLPFDSMTLRRAAFGEIQRIIREVDPPRPSTRLSTLIAAGSGAGADAAGLRPGESGPAFDIARRRRTDPESLRRQLRGDLDWITLKAMDKDRTRRYSSACVFADDLRRHLADEPVAAGPPGAAYRARKLLRRHRVAASVAAAFALLIAGALATTTFLYREAAAERAIAMTERGRAESEMGKATAALLFLREMLGALDPAEARGREITVREMLDAAAARLDASGGAGAPAAPAIEAVVRETIGEAYYQLGRFDGAEKHLRRAFELHSIGQGPEGADTLTALHNLGAAALSLGRLDEAEGHVSRALEARRRTLSIDHPDTLASMSLLAHVRQRKGDFDGAETLVREALAAQTRVLGPADRATLETMCGLADLLDSQGRLKEAEAVAAEAATLSARSLGDDDPMTLQARSIRAASLATLGRLDEAEQTLRSVLRAKERVFGAAHPESLTTANSLSLTLQSARKLDESIELCRTILERASGTLGDAHPSTLTYRHNLAGALHMAGRTDEAEQHYRAVYEARRDALGPSAEETLVAQNGLALLLLDLKRPADALPLLEEVLTGLASLLPAGHWMLGVSHACVAECLAELERRDEAVKQFEAGVAILTAALGAEHARTVDAAGKLAKVRGAE